MAVRNFKELIVWQKSMELTTEIYQLCKQFPREEVYGLKSQICRAAVSVPSNIAEGQGRKSTAEFLNFLSIAKGSLCEIETQLIIATNLNYLKIQDTVKAQNLIVEIKKMLSSLCSSLNKP